MMLPRLKLLKELLRQDGAIFVSIDDNEVHHLRALMDEIFGEQNFVATVVWEKGRKNDARLFSVGHEYMIVYARSMETLRALKTVWREPKPGAKEIWNEYCRLRKEHGDNDKAVEKALREWYRQLPKSHPAKALSRYKHVDKYGPWRDRDISWPGGGGPRYDVLHPVTNQPCKVPERGWGFGTAAAMQRQIDLGLIVFREDHTKPPFRKAHLRPISEELDDDEDHSDNSEADQDDIAVGMQVMPSVIYKQSQIAVKYLRDLMGEKVFNNPKDHEVIARIIRYCTSQDEGDIILDSFAGSGTTAQAVLALNAEDGGNRRFILVEQEEYAVSLTAERVRRVIEGVPEVRDPALQAGYGGSFAFFRLGEALDEAALLSGDELPTYHDLGRYVFFTATGEHLDERQIVEERAYLGESQRYQVYMIYRPDVAFLKRTPLTLEWAQALGPAGAKPRLVIAPYKLLDDDLLRELRIEYCQLPFGIYRFRV
jgi:adenine-specific DNA-methyltransferase